MGQLFKRFGPLMSVVAGVVLLVLEFGVNYRRNHEFSIFWIGIAICMLLVGGYELFTRKNDDHSPLE
jgi:high-affinity Fe2+/Pb2+ permease